MSDAYRESAAFRFAYEGSAMVIGQLRRVAAATATMADTILADDLDGGEVDSVKFYALHLVYLKAAHESLAQAKGYKQLSDELLEMSIDHAKDDRAGL